MDGSRPTRELVVDPDHVVLLLTESTKCRWTYERNDALSRLALAPFIALGLLLVLVSFQQLNADPQPCVLIDGHWDCGSTDPPPQLWAGLALIVCPFAIWIAFGWYNARWLRRERWLTRQAVLAAAGLETDP